MGLKDTGFPAMDYQNHRKRIAVKLYEGNLIYDGDVFDEYGRLSHGWKTQTPMHIGQYVQIHEDSTPDRIIVKPAEKASEAHGLLRIHPQLRSGIGWTEDEQNILPTENKNWGEYVPRGATCEFFGYAIDELKVADQNGAIAAGDYLDSTENEEFEKSNSATRWIAMHKVEALKGGFVQALEIQP